MNATVSARTSVDGATLGELVGWGAAALFSCSDSARLDAELLLAHAVGIGRSTLFAFPERTVAAAARHTFEQLIARRCDEVPTAYLLGRREFYSLSLEVGPAVLVPRPETELVVATVLTLLAPGEHVRMLDLGTGSGAIALAVKHHRPDVQVTAIDSSAAALEIAQANATAFGFEVEFLRSDWFEALAGRRFEAIVANPPYVASSDPALSGALRHEPAAALDGGPDGLNAIRTIVGAAAHHLMPGGALLIEHGDTQGAAARRLASSSDLVEVRTLKDLAGHDRVLLARLP